LINIFLFAFSIAFKRAILEKSIPVTSKPRLAKKKEFSPVPHPMSRIGPFNSNFRISQKNALCILPISQGGVPKYA
jgi:hypothetical protein